MSHIKALKKLARQDSTLKSHVRKILPYMKESTSKKASNIDMTKSPNGLLSKATQEVVAQAALDLNSKGLRTSIFKENAFSVQDADKTKELSVYLTIKRHGSYVRFVVDSGDWEKDFRSNESFMHMVNIIVNEVSSFFNIR